eukprot:9297918-Pyramimonas_sp.AAC.1
MQPERDLAGCKAYTRASGYKLSRAVRGDGPWSITTHTPMRADPWSITTMTVNKIEHYNDADSK